MRKEDIISTLVHLKTLITSYQETAEQIQPGLLKKFGENEETLERLEKEDQQFRQEYPIYPHHLEGEEKEAFEERLDAFISQHEQIQDLREEQERMHIELTQAQEPTALEHAQTLRHATQMIQKHAKHIDEGIGEYEKADVNSNHSLQEWPINIFLQEQGLLPVQEEGDLEGADDEYEDEDYGEEIEDVVTEDQEITIYPWVVSLTKTLELADELLEQGAIKPDEYGFITYALRMLAAVLIYDEEKGALVGQVGKIISLDQPLVFDVDDERIAEVSALGPQSRLDLTLRAKSVELNNPNDEPRGALETIDVLLGSVEAEGTFDNDYDEGINKVLQEASMSMHLALVFILLESLATTLEEM